MMSVEGIRVFSYGGGVQSTAALVLASRGEIDYKTFAFANTGDDSENPDTLSYVRAVAIPFAEQRGITLVELQKKHGGEVDTLSRMIERRKRSIDIPVWVQTGAPGRRQCTRSFKIMVVGRYTKSLGATVDEPATVGVGISLDEFHRMRTSSPVPWERRDYPLIALRLTRADCVAIIAREGLPIPPKSACWFCPFKRTSEWLDMAKRRPDLFHRAVALEMMLNERRREIGKDAVFLSHECIPLRDIAQRGRAVQLEMDMACDIGSCMT